MQPPNPGYHPGTVTCHTQPDTIAQVVRALHKTARTVILVPTRGHLHAGHRGVIEMAARVPGSVVVVAAVSPDNSHLEHRDTDIAFLKEMQHPTVPLYFSPDYADLFPQGMRTVISTDFPNKELVPPPGLEESITRLVALTQITRPDRVFVGERDFHQLVALRHAFRDLSIPASITAVNTLRDSNGMALSQHNQDEHYAPALALSAALVAGAHNVRFGKEAVIEAARGVLEAEPGLKNVSAVLVDYDLNVAPEEGDTRLLVTAQLADDTYCHDNVGLLIVPAEG
ncbi:MAG: pantoate--beta-alanine ligase [Lawsonella sp.]